jgi:hypothetical protein
VSDRLEQLLRETPVPDADGAATRTRAAVLRAFDARPPAQRRRRSALRLGLGIVAAALLAGAAAASSGHLPVASLVSRDAPSTHVRHLQPTHELALPFPAEVLVHDDAGIVVIRRNGTVRRLGPFADAAWSPNARFVVLTGGRHLVVADPVTGAHHWSITANAAVRDARWSLEPTAPPCCRIAYRSGGDLHVIAGDGTGDHVVARTAPVAPAWRPHSTQRELAFSAPDGSVHLVAADGGQGLAPALRPGFTVRSLVWSADGTRLVVVGAKRVAVYRAGARAPYTVYRAPAQIENVSAVLAGRAASLLVLQRGMGETSITPVGTDGKPSHGTAWTGTVGGLSLSPDGRHLLADLHGRVDEWLVIEAASLQTTHVLVPTSISTDAHPIPGGLHAPRTR